MDRSWGMMVVPPYLSIIVNLLTEPFYSGIKYTAVCRLIPNKYPYPPLYSLSNGYSALLYPFKSDIFYTFVSTVFVFIDHIP